MEKSMTKNIVTLLLIVFTWLSLAVQLYLTTGSVINFFSYFTILSNLLVALSLSFSFFFPASSPGLFFSKLSVQSAIALYIFIVGLVYNLVLRGIVELSGWQLAVDTALHVIIPVSYILYWISYRSEGSLKWNDGLHWIYFPMAYLIYSLIRGSLKDWYPYPFLNAANLGYQKVFVNVVMMIGTFFISGLILIAITRSLKKNRQVTSSI